MTRSHKILAFALTLTLTGLPTGLLMAQMPAPAPAEPATVDPASMQVPVPQDRPVPAPKQSGKVPAKKPLPGKTSKVEKGPDQKPGKKDIGESAGKTATKSASKTSGATPGKTASKTAKKDGKDGKKTAAKKTGKKTKKSKKVEAEEMKKVTINIETKDAADEDEVPVPEGANEDDIRAIRGANAMLKAEKQLKKILKNLKVKGALPVPFRKIDSWTYEEGLKGMPKDIRKLDGKRVVMAGFMLPIYEVENIKTFYLVKSLWSCCYGMPPDVNGLIRVEVKKKGGVNYQYDPIFIVGTFKVKEIKDDDYTVCLYEIQADDVRVLDLKIK